MPIAAGAHGLLLLVRLQGSIKVQPDLVQPCQLIDWEPVGTRTCNPMGWVMRQCRPSLEL